MVNEIYTLATSPEATELRSGNKRPIQQLNKQFDALMDIVNNQTELRSFFQSHLPVRSQNSPILTPEQLSHSVTHIKATECSQRFPCTSHCRCLCHESRRFDSPRTFQRLIGTLFLGYSGYPISNFQRCTENSCQGQQVFRVSAVYVFPSWLLARLLAVTVIKSLGSEIHFSLKVQRIVSSGAEVLRLTLLNDVTGLQRLFSKGLASPNDINHVTGQNVLIVGPLFYPVQKVKVEFITQRHTPNYQ